MIAINHSESVYEERAEESEKSHGENADERRRTGVTSKTP